MRTLSMALFTVLLALMLVPSSAAQDESQNKFRKAWQRVQRREAMAEARERGQRRAQVAKQRKVARAKARNPQRRRGQAMAQNRRPGRQGPKAGGNRGQGGNQQAVGQRAQKRNPDRKVAAVKHRKNQAQRRPAGPQRPMANGQRKVAAAQTKGPAKQRPAGQRMVKPMGADKRMGAGDRVARPAAKRPKVAAAKTRNPGQGKAATRPGKWQRRVQAGQAKRGQRAQGKQGAKGRGKGKPKVARAKPAPKGAMKARWAKQQSKGQRSPSKVDIKKAPKTKSAASLLRSKDE